MAAITTTEERDEGGDLLLWVLVWGELAAFGILLTGYVVMSMLHPESFALAKLHLAPRLAGLNTVVLLASSWQAALAVSSKENLACNASSCSAPHFWVFSSSPSSSPNTVPNGRRQATRTCRPFSNSIFSSRAFTSPMSPSWAFSLCWRQSGSTVRRSSC